MNTPFRSNLAELPHFTQPAAGNDAGENRWLFTARIIALFGIVFASSCERSIISLRKRLRLKPTKKLLAEALNALHDHAKISAPTGARASLQSAAAKRVKSQDWDGWDAVISERIVSIYKLVFPSPMDRRQLSLLKTSNASRPRSI